MDCSPPGSSVLGFSRKEYWSGLPFPSPGDLPEPGIEPGSPALQADSLPLSHQESPHLPLAPQSLRLLQTLSCLWWLGGGCGGGLVLSGPTGLEPPETESLNSYRPPSPPRLPRESKRRTLEEPGLSVKRHIHLPF